MESKVEMNSDLATDTSPPDDLPPPNHPSIINQISHLQAVKDASDPSNGTCPYLSMSNRPVILGSRSSQLALVQTEHVKSLLSSKYPSQTFKVSSMTTAGDNNQSQALYLLGGKALWTKELEVALLAGVVDIVIHCLKDMPTTLPEGCELGAILEREDPSDCLVVKGGLDYKTLEDLPDGSVVGTSSVRRVAQLRRKFPNLIFSDVRGNLNTRLSKLDSPTGPYTALILASAGLIRINMSHRITSSITSPTLFHAVGQGALGVEIRSGDTRMKEFLQGIECWETELRCEAEREMLRVLEGGCSVPVGCETVIKKVETVFPKANGNTIGTNGITNGIATNGVNGTNGTSTHGINGTSKQTYSLKLDSVIASVSGDRFIEYSKTALVDSVEGARELGKEVALELVARGGKQILEELGRNPDAVHAIKGVSRQEVREAEVCPRHEMPKEVI